MEALKKNPTNKIRHNDPNIGSRLLLDLLQKRISTSRVGVFGATIMEVRNRTSVRVRD